METRIIMTDEDLNIEREILQAVKDCTSCSGDTVAGARDVYNRAQRYPFLSKDFGWRVGLAAERGFVNKTDEYLMNLVITFN